MINLFYHDDKWIISTRSWIGGDNNWTSHKTFGLMFDEAFKIMNISYKQFDKTCCYSFVLQHPLNRIVFRYNKPNLVLVQVIKINNDSYKFLDYRAIGKQMGISVPAIILFDSYNNMIKEVELLKYYIQGFVIKINNKRYKIRNPKYNTVKKIRGNTSSIRLRYIELRKANKVKEFLKYFREYADECYKTKKSIHNLTSDLYYHYNNYFIKQNKNYIIPSYFKDICNELHNHYHVKKLFYATSNIKQNPKITYGDCIAFVNELDEELLLKKISQIYYE